MPELAIRESAFAGYPDIKYLGITWNAQVSFGRMGLELPEHSTKRLVLLTGQFLITENQDQVPTKGIPQPVDIGL